MTDSAIVETAASPAADKKVKKAATKAKKPAASQSHPTTQVMVDDAIETLMERGGSSTQAIKKYIASTYKVDAQKFSTFIKKYLVSAVSSGKLIQTKGQGATGSFKLADSNPKKAAVEKKKYADAKNKAVAKKASEKKKTEKSKGNSAKKTGTVKAKSPTKPKAPKAKTAVAAKSKKAAPAKKPAARKSIGRK